MLIGFIVFFGLSLLILAHEAGHFFAARRYGMRIDEFGFGFPPRIKAWKRGETEYSLNWLPFGGFVKIAGENDRIQGMINPKDVPAHERKRMFMFQSPLRRMAVILAGVVVNFLLGWLLLSFIFAVGTPQALIVTGVQPDSPAEHVGLKSGDVLTEFKTSEEFIQFIDVHRGAQVTIAVRRGAEEFLVTATPRAITQEGEGALGVLLGDVGVPKHPPVQAFGAGLRQAALLFWYTLLAFGELVQNLVIHATIPEGVAGPVGIFSVAQETGQLGLIYLAQLLALISINLAVLNLIPFPALDGGRFFLIVVEMLKGSPVSIRTEALLNGVGFMLLMLLIIGITVNDFLRIFS